MTIERKILQTLTIVFIGNFNFFFLYFCIDYPLFKGVVPFIIFLPYFFTIVAIKLLFYDSFYKKIKTLQNKLAKIVTRLILFLFILIFAIALQTVIYYIVFEALSTWK